MLPSFFPSLLLFHGLTASDFRVHPILSLLFRQFALGLVTVEMLVREMQFKQLTIQYSFHTPVAVSALKFVGVDDVY